MKNLKEQRVCVKFCLKFEKTATETWKMLQQAFGDECMSRTQCFNGTVVSKQGEHRLMKIPKVDDLPRQQTMFTLMQFVI
jgi:hypothetical protein